MPGKTDTTAAPGDTAPDTQDAATGFSAFDEAVRGAAPEGANLGRDNILADEELDDDEKDRLALGLPLETDGPKAKAPVEIPGEGKVDGLKTAEELAAEKAAGKDGQPAGKTKTPEEIAADEEAAAVAAAAAAGTPAPDAAVEKQIADLKLSKTAAERFRDMASGLKEKDTQIAQMQPVMEMGIEFQRNVDASQATPEQVGRAFAITYAINSGDPVLQRQAFDALTEERAALAKALGIATESYNPLDEDADLKRRVEEGDLDQATALRLIELERGTKAVQAKQAKTQAQVDTTTATQQGFQAVATAFNTLRTADPLFGKVIDAATPQLNRMQSAMSPDKWAAESLKIYEEMKPLVVQALRADQATPPARVGRVPGRASGAASGGDPRPQKKEITDPYEGLLDGMRGAYEKAKNA